MSEEFMGVTPPSTAEGSSPTPEAPKVEAKKNTDYSEFLEAITNSEGKPKYKSVPDALLGAAKAQEHIARIEQENANLRGIAQKVETLEQVLARLETGKPADQPVMPKVEDQESLVLSVLEKREAALRETQNRNAVLDSLKEKYGDKVSEILTAKANDLGLSVADLGAMAAKSPKAVLSYFQVEAKGTPAVQGTVNPQALQPKSDGIKTPENIMWGASTKDVVGFFRQIKAEVNKELGI
jgi:hypothetical protein